MKELSLHILDIAMNGIKAGATLVSVELVQKDAELTITITDNGCGMSEETLQRLSDPFFTTRTTRKVGMGVPLYLLAAQQTGGDVKISSVQQPAQNHGTTVKAVFRTDSIDCAPMGDLISTLMTLLQGYPQVDFVFRHETQNALAELDTRQIKAQIGDIPINSFEILNWIREYLNEQYRNP